VGVSVGRHKVLASLMICYVLATIPIIYFVGLSSHIRSYNFFLGRVFVFYVVIVRPVASLNCSYLVHFVVYRGYS